ncbi:hypothetical protein AX774_g3690 [Zancudomyces culisetae]|uniref:Uncharacterized protein n=1 Tax=Zancudomyces culisetae TaxID=1213189 RepID=A0A1R1PPE7_ZANCU|nr:hypothetical protein AX774_g3690 [Zancudomyces culisetae]|eukprot:OMH82820.1 hypothetical protein AX774_g3690 [Zancudomyces culisetae]
MDASKNVSELSPDEKPGHTNFWTSGVPLPYGTASSEAGHDFNLSNKPSSMRRVTFYATKPFLYIPLFKFDKQQKI